MNKSARARRLGLILLSALCLLTLCACGGSDPILGLWEAAYIDTGDREMPIEHFAEELGVEVTLSLHFDKDGGVTGEYFENPVQGTYALTDDLLTVNLGGEDQIWTFTGAEIILDQQLGVRVILTKSGR